MESQGFKHAGDEAWYWNADDQLAYKVCKNEAHESESIWCSNISSMMAACTGTTWDTRYLDSATTLPPSVTPL